jgi:hypothetical protein
MTRTLTTARFASATCLTPKGAAGAADRLVRARTACMTPPRSEALAQPQATGFSTDDACSERRARPRQVIVA